MSEFTLEEAISKRRSDRAFDDRSLTVSLLHKLLWAGQGITDESGKRMVEAMQLVAPIEPVIHMYIGWPATP